MSKKTPQQKGRKSRLPQQNIPEVSPDSTFRLTGVSPNINFRPRSLEYESQQAPQQQFNPFAMNRNINRPFIPPYQNNQQPQQSYSRRSHQSMHGSPDSCYRPTMDSSMSSYSNYQYYSPANRINLDACDFLEQLDNNPNFYAGTGSGFPSQQMSPGYQGSGHGSVPNDDLVGDDDDNTLSEEMSPVKPKKRATTKGKKKTVEKAVEKEFDKDNTNWSKEEEKALCMAWCDSSEDSAVGNNQNSKGFWKKVITYFENEVGEGRSYNSITTKWKNRIRPRVGAFCAIYDNCFTNFGSGENDLTIYQRACDEYEIMMRHAFHLDHCWEILKDHDTWKKNEMPTFLDQNAARKKPRTSETGSDVPDNEEPRNERPVGRDAAKKKVAQKKSSGFSLDGVAEKWTAITSKVMGKKKELADGYYKLKQKELEQRDMQLALEQKKTEQEERRLAVKEQKLELERQKKYQKDLIFYFKPIDSSLPAFQRQKLQEIKDSIKEQYNLED